MFYSTRPLLSAGLVIIVSLFPRAIVVGVVVLRSYVCQGIGTLAQGQVVAFVNSIFVSGWQQGVL
jgi:hypothetical protein